MQLETCKYIINSTNTAPTRSNRYNPKIPRTFSQKKHKQLLTSTDRQTC